MYAQDAAAAVLKVRTGAQALAVKSGQAPLLSRPGEKEL